MARPRCFSDVAVCGHSTRPGTHPVLPGGRSARPSICARSSSRKRAQSARRSSETNSPGSSDSGPGALSGCCLGSRIHFPLPVETVGNSCVTAGAARLGLSSGYVAARLYAVASGPPTPQTFGQTRPTGGAVKLSRQDDLCEPGCGAWPLRLAKRRRSAGREAGAPALLIVGGTTRQYQADQQRSPRKACRNRPRCSRLTRG